MVIEKIFFIKISLNALIMFKIYVTTSYLLDFKLKTVKILYIISILT